MPTPHQIATEFEIETELLPVKSLGKDFIECKNITCMVSNTYVITGHIDYYAEINKLI